MQTKQQSVWGTKTELRASVGGSQTSWSPLPPVILLLAVPMWLFCFGSLVISDVVCRYLSFFFLYINIKIDVKMLNYPVTTCMGNSCSLGCCWWLLWWRLFVQSFFPRDVFGWDLGLNWVSLWRFSYLLLSMFLWFIWVIWTYNFGTLTVLHFMKFEIIEGHRRFTHVFSSCHSTSGNEKITDLRKASQTINLWAVLFGNDIDQRFIEHGWESLFYDRLRMKDIIAYFLRYIACPRNIQSKCLHDPRRFQ